MPSVNFTAAAEELRRQEFSRLSAAVTPRIEAFRSITADAFRTEIMLMLERLGHTVVSSVSDIVTTKQGRKYVTACATPPEVEALADRNDAMLPPADSDDFGQSFRAEVGHLFRSMSAGHSD